MCVRVCVCVYVYVYVCVCVRDCSVMVCYVAFSPLRYPPPSPHPLSFVQVVVVILFVMTFLLIQFKQKTVRAPVTVATSRDL